MVPSLPADVEGDAELFIVYTRARRWVARWQVSPGRDVPDHWRKTRLIRGDAGPDSRARRVLIEFLKAREAP